MMNKFILSILFFSILGKTSFAIAKDKAVIDKETKIRPATAMKVGDRLFAESYYYNAAEMYKQALMAKSNVRYAMYWLAKSYYMSRDYEKSVYWFDKFTKVKSKNDKEAKKNQKQDAKYFTQVNYDYALSLQMNGQYNEAIERFISFTKDYDGEDKAMMEKLSNAHIEGCQFAKANDTSKKIRVKEVNKMLNNAYTESAPFPVGDSVLYFTSLNHPKLIQINDWRKVKKAKLYKTVLSNGEWQKPQALPEYINTPEYEIGNCAISADGKRMYFTKCYHPMEDEVICNLFLSQNLGGKWLEPIALNAPINDPKYTTTQPTIRPIENGSEMIYFVSDRPGGSGDMDIWYFIRNQKGDIKGPMNAKGLNTVGNEFTPSWDETKKAMYYSSDGLPGYGGFDIFKTQQSEDMTWSKAENMGKPLNTQYDDIYYTRIAGSNSGYLVSNRKGTTVLNSENASDDIFQFEDFKYGLEGVISSSDGDGGPLKNVIVKLYGKNAAGIDSLIAIDSSITAEGEYFFKLSPDADYKVTVERDGFLPKSELISTVGLPFDDTISQDLRIKLNTLNLNGNVYKEGDASKKTLSNVSLVLYEINNKGKEVMVENLKTSDVNPQYHFLLDNDKSYIVRYRKEGYFSNSYTIEPSRYKDSPSKVQDLYLTEIELNKAYTLSNIYYEYKKADLTGGSKKVLDDLKILMDENPLIIIELSSHTDNIGSDKYNIDLSQRRAQSCVNYLISIGVSRERLVAKGYGKSAPIVPNNKPDGTDDPDGRAKNRRTAFKILGELKGKSSVNYEEKDGIKK